jgi:hypothetical protein
MGTKTRSFSALGWFLLFPYYKPEIKGETIYHIAKILLIFRNVLLPDNHLRLPSREARRKENVRWIRSLHGKLHH